MKYNFRKNLITIIVLCLIIGIGVNVCAHPGRTDSNGGHKDKQNKSGLGGYHYHCGGYPAHLHDNGGCPYFSSTSGNKNTENTDATESIIKAKSIEINEDITRMKVGESSKLTAIITPENTVDKSVTWSSDNKVVATVSTTGKVVALKEGNVNITVTTSNGKSDTITITVEEIKKVQEGNNTSGNSEEDSNVISSMLGLALIGGGTYLGYKKYKNSIK